MSVFKDKVLLITGGTGSFGNAVLRRFPTTLVAPVSINCKTLHSNAGDFRVEYALASGSSGVIVDCENVEADFSNSQQYRLLRRQ